MVKESPHGGPERPFLQAIIILQVLKAGLYWILQDVGDTRAISYLPRRPANRVWSWLTREEYVIVNKTGKSGRYEECSDIRHRDMNLEFVLLGFFPALVQYFLSFGMVIYILYL